MHFRILKMPPSSCFLKLLSAPDSFSAAEHTGGAYSALTTSWFKGGPYTFKGRGGERGRPLTRIPGSAPGVDCLSVDHNHELCGSG